MQKSTTKVIKIAAIVLLVIGLIQGVAYGMDRYDSAMTAKAREESKIEFKASENKAAEIVGYWAGVYQEDPCLHMIFTQTDYEIIQEQGSDVNAYPVLEKGTWIIDGDNITLTAINVANGVTTPTARSFAIKLETSLKDENNFTILKIGANPTYFYGTKVDSQEKLVSRDWTK